MQVQLLLLETGNSGQKHETPLEPLGVLYVFRFHLVLILSRAEATHSFYRQAANVECRHTDVLCLTFKNARRRLS